MYVLLGHNSISLLACYLSLKSHSNYRLQVPLLGVISANPCLALLQFPLAGTPLYMYMRSGMHTKAGTDTNGILQTEKINWTGIQKGTTALINSDDRCD